MRLSGCGRNAGADWRPCLDLEPLWLRRAELLLEGESELAPTDLANRRTFEARHNDRNLMDLRRDFRVARRTLVARLEEADAASLGRTALHPRLRTPMTLTDLAYFVAEHDDHHLVTIGRLLRSGGRP
ncbi:MAG: DinB family protein [Vicinamibacterales bacterium]